MQNKNKIKELQRSGFIKTQGFGKDTQRSTSDSIYHKWPSREARGLSRQYMAVPRIGGWKLEAFNSWVQASDLTVVRLE